MNTHTPGPWRIGRNHSVVTDTPDEQVVIRGDHAAETIDFYGGHVIAETVTPANAALIAAAPDLLSVARAALIVLESQLTPPEWICRQLREAIEKAQAVVPWQQCI